MQRLAKSTRWQTKPLYTTMYIIREYFAQLLKDQVCGPFENRNCNSNLKRFQCSLAIHLCVCRTRCWSQVCSHTANCSDKAGRGCATTCTHRAQLHIPVGGATSTGERKNVMMHSLIMGYDGPTFFVGIYDSRVFASFGYRVRRRLKMRVHLLQGCRPLPNLSLAMQLSGYLKKQTNL